MHTGKTVPVAGCLVFGMLVMSASLALAQLTDEDIEGLKARARAEGWSFEVGRNPATEQPLEALCGLKRPADWREGARFNPFTPDGVQLPSRFDWRDYGCVPPIRDQDGCGSCWAFATVGPLECNIRIKDGVDANLSEQWLVSCNQNGWGCGGGSWAHNYYAGWSSDSCGGSGAVLERDFPYKAADRPCSCPWDHYYTIDDWRYIGSGGWPSVEQIKQAIMDYGPVTAGVYVDSAFQAYKGGVFNAPGWGIMNHGVVLVGWNDNQGPSGVWFLRNSWGKAWGEGGYMRIAYYNHAVGSWACYVDYPGVEENPHVEHGAVWAGSNWTTVNFLCPFVSPIVVAGPATTNGWAPGVVRVRNVRPGSFQIKFQEWDYLNGVHCPELIHWIAINRGVYHLSATKKLIADDFVTNKTSVLHPKWVGFPEAFSETPVVLTQIQTFKGTSAVTDRICKVYPGGFHFTMQEQESKTGHCNERVGYIAVKAGTTDLLGEPCEVKRTKTVVTHNPCMLVGSEGQAVVRIREEQSKDAETLHRAAEKVGFISLLDDPPVVADMQTCNEADPCELRCTLLSPVLWYEDGVVSANHQWQTVTLSVSFVDPVVLAGPATYAGKAPGEIRVRNVTPTSFQIRFQEWDYLDGVHCYEQIHWMAAERGVWDMGGGDMWIADEFLTKNANAHSPSWVRLPLALTASDLVIATQQTANGASCVTERISDVGATGFNVALQEEEAADAIHAEENIGYLASGTGTGGLPAGGAALSLGIKPLRAGGGASGVSPTQDWHVSIVEEQSKNAETSHGWEKVAGLFFSLTPSGEPPFILDMQTCYGVDPCSLRLEYVLAPGTVRTLSAPQKPAP